MRWQAYFTLACAVGWGAAAPAMAQPAAGEPALVKRTAELREQPGESSRTLGALAPQTPVTRLPQRAGAWVQVRTAQGTDGWLHIFDLTSAAAGGTAGGNTAAGALRGLTGFFNRTGGPSVTTATSTVGIRGLSAEDLSRAQPNPAAVGQAEALRQDAAAAQAFAAAAQLQQRPLVILPEPPRTAGGASGSPSGARNAEVLP